MNYMIHELFPIPLYHARLAPVDSLTLAKLTNLKFDAPGAEEEYVVHEETVERHVLDRPEFIALKKTIQAHIDHYVYELLGVTKDQRWEVSSSWVNKSAKGNYHANHWHSNSLVSGVLYLRTDEKSGAICFNKDRSHRNLWGDTITIDFVKPTIYNSAAMSILPTDGDLLLFPSLLNHSVEHNESSIDRYSLAFNVFPRGTIGPGGNCELTV